MDKLDVETNKINVISETVLSWIKKQNPQEKKKTEIPNPIFGKNNLNL